MCQRRKVGHERGNCCGMCKVSNQPNLGAKPSALQCNGHWKAPWRFANPCAMCWWPNRLVICKFQGLGGQGWAILCLQMWRSCRPGLQKCPNPTKSQPKWANGAPGMPDWSIIFQKWSQKTLCSPLRPLWQAPLGNVPISCNLAQNLSSIASCQQLLSIAVIGIGIASA